MRILSVLAIAVTSAVAQGPIVRITSTTHAASNDFHIGDRYEIVISAGSPCRAIKAHYFVVASPRPSSMCCSAMVA